MKKFQKYGVAAAVASVATGVVAQEVSKKEAGDLAIIPYYTVLDGKNTGMHIINTTDVTQVVKVRLRRGADSKDSLDFNLVMSPRDEWTANIGANPDGDGVVVTTNDTTCTVPAFPEGGAVMPSTFAEGAEEGYVEIIAMAQATSGNTIAVAAEHDDGVPLSCAVVRQNFYRVSDTAAYFGTGAPFPNGRSTTRGTHYSDITSSAVCTANAADTGGACDIESVREALATTAGGFLCADKNDYTALCNDAIIDLLNASFYDQSDDAALKVSWMITDSDGGLEIGDNAVMVEGFSGVAMMTNQELLDFGIDGILNYDPLNFELPNLSYSAWNAIRGAQLVAPAVGNASVGSLMPGLMDALDAESLINDWAAFDTDSGTVATDWVVTLPGQYTMQNPICDAYDAYSEAGTACAITTAGTNVGLSSAGATDEDQLPLTVADGAGTNMLLWDREETPLIETPDTPDTDLGFSPGGSAGTPADTYVLAREVNVIMFNDGNVLGTADLQDEDLGLGFVVAVSDEGYPPNRGWGELVIEEVADEMIWFPEDQGTGTDVDPNDDTDADKDGWGGFVDSGVDTVAVVGFAAWERSFADQAGNYGRAIEHSTISSAR
jgi:hypothetical protein